MNLILNIGLVLLAGFAVSWLLRLWRLPEVTAYIIAGIILGPAALNLIDPGLLKSAASISFLALSLIAFTIGQQFSLSMLRRRGRQIILITLAEASGAWILVTLAVWLIFNQPFVVALLLGAIGSATAPAATLLVVQQFRAKGPLTSTILAVVAMDDAYSIMAFALAGAIAIAAKPGNAIPFEKAAGGLLEIGISLLMGLAAGLILMPIVKRIEDTHDRLVLVLGAIMVTAGAALTFEISPLLSSIAMGSVLVNTDAAAGPVFRMIDSFAPPIYEIFFILGGASLNFDLLPQAGLLGIGYIISRAAGKYIGAYIGASATKSEQTIRRWLGTALVPQAGVAIGLALIASGQFPGFGPAIANVIVSATVIYELIGPLLTKMAISRAGEATR